ncbi:MAG: N-acetylmuramoyl-L-alanine amidase [Rivularia sp. (in: cyanobacteria)]
MAFFCIDIGHNCFPDTGAVGLKSEDYLTKEIGSRVIERLIALGHRCVSSLPSNVTSVNDSLRQRVQIANNNNVDVVVSIHFNASKGGRGRGTETYYISRSGRKFAKSVNNELVKLGFRNRGSKHGSWYLLRNTKAPAILIEVAFCDNASDMDLVDKVGLDAIANAIVCGLTI